MRRLLVLQHVPGEPLGHLDPLLRRAGLRLRYVNFGREPQARPDVKRYDGVVVLGGPMNVDQQDRYPHLTHEIELLQEATARNLGVLGICLGAQLLAAALGADVRPAPVPEIGWVPLEPRPDAAGDPLLRHIGHGQRVFQWHAQTFDLPPGAVHLAGSPTCPNQAFRHGERAWGFQFHLEADPALIGRWLHVPAYRAEAQQVGGESHPERVQAETPHHAPAAAAVAERVFSEFVGLSGPRRRFHHLPTRPRA